MAQSILIFIVVLALLAVVVWAIRTFAGHRFAAGSGPRAPRLGVIDSVPVDAKRRLVLVRRDQFEHLLLIGGPTDIVVEETIYRGVPLASYPRNEGVRGSAPQAVPGNPQTALRGAPTGSLPQAGEQGQAAALGQAERSASPEPPAPSAEAAPTAPPRQAQAAPQPVPERWATAFAAASGLSPVEPHSAIEPHTEVPFGPVDRQSRAASFATRFQSGFGRGSVARRTAPHDAAPVEAPSPVQTTAAELPAAAMTSSAAPAAAPAADPSPPPAAEAALSDSDWITPAFADALEPRQAVAAGDPPAGIDEPPAEEVLAAAPEIEETAPPPPVEFAPRAARRANQANLEQEMARLLGEIASKRSR